MEQARVCISRQDMNERGRPKPERRPTTGPLERQGVERFGPGQDGDPGTRSEGPRLEIGEQPGVLLGLAYIGGVAWAIAGRWRPWAHGGRVP